MGDDRTEGNARDGIIESLANENQNPQLLEKIRSKAQEILTRDEKIVHIAVQKKPVANITPDAVILTNRRIICYRPKLFGRVVSFDDHLWRDLSDVQLVEGVFGSTLVIITVEAQRTAVDYLPKAQARQLYAFAQEMEEKVREERRRRHLEEKRAEAGGVVIGAGGGVEASGEGGASVDPVERLKKLKEMLDAGLITEGEFDGKRAEIISKI